MTGNVNDMQGSESIAVVIDNDEWMLPFCETLVKNLSDEGKMPGFAVVTRVSPTTPGLVSFSPVIRLPVLTFCRKVRETWSFTPVHYLPVGECHH